MLTFARLKDVLSYNPETGVFVWLRQLSNRGPIGKKAGSYISGYLEISIDNRTYRAHRLAWLYMTGEWPKGHLDHKNCVRDDNRWENLRPATAHQNVGNMRRPKHNRSGVKGVYWDVSRKKWHAQIAINGRSTSLGRFHDINDAAAAYERAAKAHFGEFMRLE